MKVKVLEALACGIPVVTTPDGAEGIAPNAGVVVHATDADLAKAAIAILSDSAERTERGVVARATFLERYAPARPRHRSSRSSNAGWEPTLTTSVLAYTDAFAWGGAEECLSTLLTELDGRFAVTVAGTTAGIVERIASHRPGAPVVVLPPFGGEVRPALDRRARARLPAARARHLPRQSPHALRLPGAIIAGVLTRTRIVAVEHLPLHSPSGFMRWTRRRLAPRYAAHVSVGIESSRLVEAEVGLRAGSVGTIYNGVPEIELPPAPVEAHAPVLGSVGPPRRAEGYDLLVEALAELPGATAVIVGEGPLRPALEERAADLGVSERLSLPGWSDNARSFLPAFDVFCPPVALRGVPLSIIGRCSPACPCRHRGRQRPRGSRGRRDRRDRPAR